MSTVRILIGGFGGQGIILLGQILGASAIGAGKNATFYPTYGPEMRGGTANCAVVISDEEIGSPLATQPDVLICFNAAALERFLPTLRTGGTLFVNSSQVRDEQIIRDDINIVRVPANSLADELGNPKVANVVMLGAVTQRTGIYTLEQAEAGVLEELSAKPHLYDINKQALVCGAEAV